MDPATRQPGDRTEAERAEGAAVRGSRGESRRHRLVAGLRGHDRAVVALLLAGLVLFLAWGLRDFRGVDDAHITYVYARSVAAGEGLTWNGAPGLGTSSPFLAVTLGTLSRLTGAEVPIAAVALGWLSVWAASWVLYLLGRAEGWPLAGLAAALTWTASGFRLHFGGEYLPAVALVLIAALAFRGGRAEAAGLALAFAVMFRAEVGLAAPLLAGARVVQAGRRAGLREVARAALFAITATAVWLAALAAIAGSVLPRTMEAKRAQAESALRVWDPAPRLAELWSHPGAGFAPGAPWLFWVLAALGVWFLARRVRTAPYAAVLVAWGVVHLLALDALGVAIYPWYATPLRLSAALLACLALESAGPSPARWRRALAVAVALALAFALFRQAAVLPGLARFQDAQRSASYRAIAALADRYPPGTSLASFEVGFVGWASAQPIRDVLGLVTPGASLDAVRAGDLAANVRGLDPDLVMVPLASGSLYSATIGDPGDFLERYRLDHLVLATGFPVALYRRSELAGLGEVAHDPLARAAATGRVFRLGSADLTSMLGVGVRGGDATALSVPPGRWGGLRVAVATDGAAAAAELVVRTPGGGRLSRPIEGLDASWRWETLPPFVTGRRARVVLRCVAPPEVACRFGQPHLLRR